MCTIEQMDNNTRIQRNIVRSKLYSVNTESLSQLDDLIHELAKYRDLLEAITSQEEVMYARPTVD